MEDKEMKQFSWTAFFLVTGLSFFMFSKLMQFLDGSKLPVFTVIGIITFAIGLFRMITGSKRVPEEK
jgi:uncharacterized membrane protein YgdD (TMEM256/DUF423 family)